MIIKISKESQPEPENNSKKELFAIQRAHYAHQYSISVSKKNTLPSFEIIVKELDKRIVHPNELIAREGAIGGQYRNKRVYIPDALFFPPAPKLVNEYMQNLGQKVDQITSGINHKKIKGLEIQSVLTVMAFSHYWLSRIHPFREGNGRTSREVNALQSLRFGLPKIFLGPIDKDEYLAALRMVDVTARIETLEANLNPFILFLARKMQRSFPIYAVDQTQEFQKDNLRNFVSKLRSGTK